MFKTFQIFRKTWIIHENGWSLELKARLFSKHCFCCQASFHRLRGYYLTDNTISINLFSHMWYMSCSFCVALQCSWAAEPITAQSASSCSKDIYLWLLAIPLLNAHPETSLGTQWSNSYSIIGINNCFVHLRQKSLT